MNDLDAALDEHTELHCMGGFAMVQAYALDRATADIDVLPVASYSSGGRLLEHAIYLDMVSVATVPEDYARRLKPLYPGIWRSLHLFVLEVHDLALTRLERNFERDRADVAHLAGAGYLQAAILRERYFKEFLWIEACFPNER